MYSSGLHRVTVKLYMLSLSGYYLPFIPTAPNTIPPTSKVARIPKTVPPTNPPMLPQQLTAHLWVQVG